MREKVGAGGFGAVWRAFDRQLNRDVAVKLIDGSITDSSRRFEVEVEALQRVNHVSFVRPTDAGITKTGEAFLVTEFIDGVTLEAWLRSQPSLDERVRVATAISHGLVAAHREGVVHRDLKPANIMVTADGVPKIVDFGIAKLSGREQPDITKTGEVLGTPGFMSPEQLQGLRNIGPATDMYAFGALLYQMLEGHPPFAGATPLERALNHLTAQPRPMVAAPPPLRTLTFELLDREPTRRPTAIAAARQLGGQSPRSTTEPSGPPRPWLAALAVLVVALALAAAVVAHLLQPPPTPAQAPETRTNPLSGADPDVVPVPEPTSHVADVGIDSADLGAPACPGFERLEPGAHIADEIAPEAVMVLPAGYNPRRKYPVIVFFHDFYQEPRLALGNIDYELPRTNDYVFVYPYGDPNNLGRQHWRGPQVDELPAQLDRLAERICIDQKNVVAIGHGRGGFGALRARCLGLTTAAATFAFRQPPSQRPRCARAIPELQIFPTDDPSAPVDGSRSCNSSTHAPVDKTVQTTRKRNGCSGKPKKLDDFCVEHQCRTPYVHCEVPGDRKWKADYNDVLNLATSLGRCPPLAGTPYDVSARIFDFFAGLEASDSGP